jgi:predicted phosphoribosyltransferase
MEREEDYNTITGNRIIILADDGAATDASIIAAPRRIKKNNKSRNHLIMLFL